MQRLLSDGLRADCSGHGDASARQALVTIRFAVIEAELFKDTGIDNINIRLFNCGVRTVMAGNCVVLWLLYFGVV